MPSRCLSRRAISRPNLHAKSLSIKRRIGRDSIGRPVGDPKGSPGQDRGVNQVIGGNMSSREAIQCVGQDSPDPSKYFAGELLQRAQSLLLATR